MLGPVDYLAIGFIGNKFNGHILDELQKVVEAGLIRVVDMVFVSKNANGEITVVELDGMPDDVIAAFSPYAHELSGLLTEEDALDFATDLENETSAGILVYEEVWAKGVKQAILNAEGFLLGEGRISQEAITAATEEVKALKAEAEEK